MLIDRLFPQCVGGKAPLRQLLLDAAASFGMPAQKAQTLIQLLPSPLIDSPGFLDRHTNLWRYEFGEPFILNDLPPLAVPLNLKLVRGVKVIPKLDGWCLQQHLN